MPYRIPSTERPEFSMPLAAASSTGFTAVYNSRFQMSRPVGSMGGEWRNYIEFDINNLPAITGENVAVYPELRKVFAMHWGKLLFSYDHQSPVSNVSSLPEDHRSRVRAYLFFPSVELRHDERVRATFGTRSNKQVDLTLIHHPASLGNLNENFALNQVTQYWNLDKDSTKMVVVDIVNAILADTSGWRSDFLNQSNPISAATWRSSYSSLGSRPRKLLGLIAGDRPRMTVRQYVDACIFSDAKLLDNIRPTGGGSGLLVRPGQCIGMMANREGNNSAVAGSAKLFLSMWTAKVTEHRLELGPFPLNPVYFAHSFLRQPTQVAFKNDLSESNRYGLAALLATPFAQLSAAPSAAQKTAVHPILWELSRISHFNFAISGPGGLVVFKDDPPPLFVESSGAFTPTFTTVPPQTGDDILGLSSRLTTFHTHVRLSSDRSRILNQGSRYDWKINERGYFLMKTRAAAERDDWYFYFEMNGNNSLLEVFKIWRDHGALINKYATAFQVPCEIVVALLARESGGNPKACALEPWYPIVRGTSGNDYSEAARNALLEADTTAWERDKTSYTTDTIFRDEKNARLLGYNFFLALNRTNSAGNEFAVGGRYGLSVPDNLNNEIALRNTALLPGFTWIQLLQLLDDLGPSVRSLGSGKFGSGIDMRISPGLSQFLVGVFDDKIFAGNRSDVIREINHAAFPDGSRTDFFFQEGVDISQITDSNRANVLSLRFKWMCIPENMIATTAFAVKRYMSRLQQVYTLPDPDFRFLNPNDPIYILGQHGGVGDLEHFSANEPFGFITSASAAASSSHAERQKWHGTLDGYNAAVFLFEQHDILTAHELPEPSVRYYQTT